VATFVLVQPAWFGGWCWDKVAADLRARSHHVFAPTLTGLGDRVHLADPTVSLRTHVDDVVAVLESEDLHNVVLVGTSSGGTVVTGVAAAAAGRIRRLVYLDAFVPSHGQCTFDLLPPERRVVLEELVRTEGDGWLVPRFAPPPWPVIVRDIWHVTDVGDAEWMLAQLQPTPVRHFTEPVDAPESTLRAMSRVYIRCTQNPAPQFDDAARTAATTQGWTLRTMDTPHLPYITHPAETVAELLDVAT